MTAAMLLAVASMMVAWRALDQARDAKSIALSNGGQRPGPTATTPTAEPPRPTDSGGGGDPTFLEPSEPDTPRSPGAPPDLNARTAYNPRYQDQTITLSAAECTSSMSADLDEPRANVASAGSDLTFYQGCGVNAARLRLGEKVDGTKSAQPGMAPQECAEQIRQAPIAGNDAIPVRKGITFCATTNYAAARESGRPWIMVLAEITGVGNDGAVTLKLTAWDIPG
ncbi:hypothetical protein [Plantactinospora sp. KBS50]|uniref:hypothetical protein n=1 Tax=Plantactinospora sp. KBS50 TaxID=2024580 RepID=UPI0018E0627B|nr:hypothetical protein [Plantactinospora sp. KBS50]